MLELLTEAATSLAQGDVPADVRTRSLPACGLPCPCAHARSSYRWMAGALATPCPAQPSSASYARPRQSSSLSCGCFTASPPATAGGTPRGLVGQCHKAKDASRAMPCPGVVRARPIRNTLSSRGRACTRMIGLPYVVILSNPGRPGQCNERRDSVWHRLHFGKTRAFALGVTAPPPGISELAEAVWRGDKPSAERGLVVLGTPIGHPDFVQAWAAERMQEERKLFHQLPELPDLLCNWLLLSMCASPRANHALRTLPLSESRGYAAAHNEAIWETLQACLGGAPLDGALPGRSPHCRRCWAGSACNQHNAPPRQLTGRRGQTRCP